MELLYLSWQLMRASDSKSTNRRETVRFVLDGKVVELDDIDPTRTVLQYLRDDRRRCGTKEGCAEGDCGACTVVVAEPDGSGRRLSFKAINSCIQFLPTLDGKELITVESLETCQAGLHPVQRAMLDCHGSQCGFCTPGFVMSLFALYKTTDRPSRREIDDALAGNLCRCTGYRPIVAAANRMYDYGEELDRETRHWMNCSFSSEGAGEKAPGERDTVDLLRSLQQSAPLQFACNNKRYFAPSRIEDLAAIVLEHPDACLLAGGTDVGLWVTKQHRDLEKVVYTGNVQELKRLAVGDTHLEIGAAVSLSEVLTPLLEHYPELSELFLRFASPPIRNAGTLGGNIANGSPIGDSMPVLIALDTQLVLRKGGGTRRMALEDFYLDYQRTALTPGEFLERILIPLPQAGALVRSYKISKRFDQDISAVCGAYRLSISDGTIDDIRIAYGGVAAIPKRAKSCEQSLIGNPWNENTVQAALTSLDRDFNPITDMRASAAYRRLITKNLLYKFYLETSGEQNTVSVYGYGR